MRVAMSLSQAGFPRALDLLAMYAAAPQRLETARPWLAASLDEGSAHAATLLGSATPESPVEFQAMALDWQESGDDRFVEAAADLPAYLEELRGRSDPERIAADRVPSSTYWLVHERARVVARPPMAAPRVRRHAPPWRLRCSDSRDTDTTPIVHPTGPAQGTSTDHAGPPLRHSIRWYSTI
jgi:hypothetical protein